MKAGNCQCIHTIFINLDNLYGQAVEVDNLSGQIIEVDNYSVNTPAVVLSFRSTTVLQWTH